MQKILRIVKLKVLPVFMCICLLITVCLIKPEKAKANPAVVAGAVVSGAAISAVSVWAICTVAMNCGVKFGSQQDMNDFTGGFIGWVNGNIAGFTEKHPLVASVGVSQYLIGNEIVKQVKAYCAGLKAGTIAKDVSKVVGSTMTITGASQSVTLDTGTPINAGDCYHFRINLNITKAWTNGSLWWLAPVIGGFNGDTAIRWWADTQDLFTSTGHISITGAIASYSYDIYLKQSKSNGNWIGIWNPSYTIDYVDVGSSSLTWGSNLKIVLGSNSYSGAGSICADISRVSAANFDVTNCDTAGNSKSNSLTMDKSISVTIPDALSIPADTVIGRDVVADPAAVTDALTTADISVSDTTAQDSTSTGDLTQPKDKTIKLQPLAQAVSDRFPFCVPFDLINMIKSLSAPAVTPHFDITFDKTKFVGGGSFSIDFAQFTTLAAILRWMLYLIFMVFLILVTRKLIKG